MANLTKGSKGTEVEELQKLLNDAGGYNLKTDGIFGDKTLAAVKDYQAKNGLAVDGIAGANTMTKLKGTSATPSTTPSAATVVNTTIPNMLSASTATAPQGVTAPTQSKSYADQVNAAIAQILERKPMQYNFSGDPLYQMYKDSALAGSQTASADAMARAAALTGGYGNSYAATVANQAAQQQMAGLNEKIPELEQLARARYDAETNRLMNNYSILSALENQEYTRKWDEDKRQYDRDKDKLDREGEAYERKLKLAELAALYGDTSKLKELGIKPGVEISTGGSGGNVTEEEIDTWTYDELKEYLAGLAFDLTKSGDTKSKDPNTKEYWANLMISKMRTHHLDANQAETLAIKGGFIEEFWDAVGASTPSNNPNDYAAFLLWQRDPKAYAEWLKKQQSQK